MQRPPAGTIPEAPGSYQFKDADGRVIYVGKAASLRQRLSSYFGDPSTMHPRTAQMVTSAQTVEWIQVRNEVEALMVAGGDSIDVPKLLSMVPRVVLTLGGSGSRYADREGRDETVPAFPVEVTDTTAAGDAFTGALAVAWGEGRDLVESVRWANAAGAACVRRVGASNALPTRDEIDEVYRTG